MYLVGPKGVLYYELLKPGERITAKLYRQQLMRLKQAVAQKRPEYATRHESIILLHDNARPHIAAPVKNYLKNIGWEILKHPPYSPDLAPSDYHLFRSMQNALTGLRFTSIDAIKNWLDDFLTASRRNSFRTEFISCQNCGKRSSLPMDNTSNEMFLQ